jgi:hypothetical protein
LANILAPRLGELVQANQSAFIKGRLIQDNFKMVQLSTRLLHARKKVNLLLKVDIAHAFDSVAWSFLLELLECLGFSSHWRDWISALLSSARTKVLLNETPDERICHAHGLPQGDSLLPILFLLVMEVLNALICKANAWSLFKSMGVHAITYRVSFYVDDLVWFVAPEQRDMQMVHAILELFEKCSGLGCNMGKYQLAPIRYNPNQVTLATSLFRCQVVDFPIKYLSITLAVTKLYVSAATIVGSDHRPATNLEMVVTSLLRSPYSD